CLRGNRLPSLAGPLPPDPPSPPLPAQGGEGWQGAVVHHGVDPVARSLTRLGSSELRHARGPVPAQRRILDQLHGVRNGDAAAVSRGGAAGFTANFENAAADEAGDG